MSAHLSDTQLENWRLYLEQYRSDSGLQTWHHDRDDRRRVAQREMLELLSGFLKGQVRVEDLKEIFDRKTRLDWNVFGFKGMSGGMFLNKLVKHVPDRAALTQQLQAALPVPASPDTGHKRMEGFDRFLEDLIASEQATRQQLDPARLPFFLSAWWHLQQPDQWPVFYVSGRRVLEKQGVYMPRRAPVADYFAFRATVQTLQSALGVEPWELEHLLSWLDEGGSTRLKPGTPLQEPPRSEAPVPPPQEVMSEEPSGSAHTRIQWLLARIGKRVNCRVWIAANDQGRTWDSQRLGDLSLKELPSIGLDAESQRLIRLIDVLWIKAPNRVVAAFEIEHTTSIYSGLLRMSDLVALSPNLNFPLYIVAPEARLDQVRRELSRPTFQTLELNKRCGYFSTESLIHEADHILRWASDPSVIEALTQYVPDIGFEDRR